MILTLVMNRTLTTIVTTKRNNMNAVTLTTQDQQDLWNIMQLMISGTRLRRSPTTKERHLPPQRSTITSCLQIEGRHKTFKTHHIFANSLQNQKLSIN
jgi:hypothetical protein